jgi:hypothetical protein
MLNKIKYDIKNNKGYKKKIKKITLHFLMSSMMDIIIMKKHELEGESRPKP